MQPFNGWEEHDENWWIKQVKITDDRWLLMFYNFSNWDRLPVGWINLCAKKWSPTAADNIPMHEMHLKEYWLQHGSMLELECIAHEWTEEILRTQAPTNTP